MGRNIRIFSRGMLCLVWRVATCCWAAVLFASPSEAQAQPEGGAPSAALLHDDESQTLARLVRARVEELGVAEVTTTPRLSLRDLQLSVGCLNASAECLDAVAGLLEVDGLLRVQVESTGARRVATLDWHAQGSSAAWRTVTAETDPEGTGTALLDSADGLVRELFDLPAAAPRDASTPPPAARDHAPSEASLSPWPLVLGGAALVAGGVAVVLGLLSRDAQQEWESAPVGSTADVDRALDRYEPAEAQARWANVGFVVAGALAAGALLWLTIDLASGEDAERATLSVGPTGATLRWTADLPLLGGAP